MSLVFAAIVSAISFLVTYFLAPPFISYLQKHGMTVKDYHKPNEAQVPRPGGPITMLSIAAAGITLFFLTMSNGILAILFCTLIAFFIGYIDDRRVMPGYFKPLALVIAALPIVLLGTYDFYLDFPLFGTAKIPLLYIGLIFAMIPVVGNTVNSIDVLNGVVSGFIAIASIPLIVALFMNGKSEVAGAALLLFFSALAFYKYHKFPSKIFPGDSGVLAWGAMYGAIAIVGEVEFVAIIALLPAIINSFFFLASVKRVAEHRTVKARPVTLLDDYRLMASKERDAPATLVRMILANGPMSENDVAKSILKLAAFSAGMAILTAFLMRVVI
jgi:UDP-N-acetylglucosamine--dolichyl-phosphate N-acetylglucosaminephosphotransferase